MQSIPDTKTPPTPARQDLRQAIDTVVLSLLHGHTMRLQAADFGQGSGAAILCHVRGGARLPEMEGTPPCEATRTACYVLHADAGWTAWGSLDDLIDHLDDQWTDLDTGEIANAARAII